MCSAKKHGTPPSGIFGLVVCHVHIIERNLPRSKTERGRLFVIFSQLLMSKKLSRVFVPDGE